MQAEAVVMNGDGGAAGGSGDKGVCDGGDEGGGDKGGMDGEPGGGGYAMRHWLCQTVSLWHFARSSQQLVGPNHRSPPHCS